VAEVTLQSLRGMGKRTRRQNQVAINNRGNHYGKEADFQHEGEFVLDCVYSGALGAQVLFSALLLYDAPETKSNKCVLDNGEMMSIKTRKDTIVAKLFTRYPGLVERWAKSHDFVINMDTPWVPFIKALKDSRIALVTTAGVHLRSQPRYDMEDREGDPSFREVPAGTRISDLMITHNYYDHHDADQDINVVFPIERLLELEAERIIGQVAPRHFSFMGHIVGRHIETLVNRTGPLVARMLKADSVDAAFLTPA
jgi:D-proline reductase (dithiol) PrdB